MTRRNFFGWVPKVAAAIGLAGTVKAEPVAPKKEVYVHEGPIWTREYRFNETLGGWQTVVYNGKYRFLPIEWETNYVQSEHQS